MALLWRVLGGLIGLALRAALVVAVLFAGHLLLTRVLPGLRETAQAVEHLPELEKRFRALSETMAAETKSAEALKQALLVRSQNQAMALSQQLGELRFRLDDLAEQRAQLTEQLSALARERDELCRSLNPFKRWMCGRARESFGQLSARLAPLIEAVAGDLKAAERARAAIERQLAVLNDSSLTHAEKLQRLGVQGAGVTALQLDVALRRAARVQAEAAELELELRRLRKLSSSRSGWLLREWRSVQLRLWWIAALVLLLPFVQRLVNYFVLMPLVVRLSPVLRLVPVAPGSELKRGQAQRTLPLSLLKGQQLLVRSEYARPVQGNAQSQLLYRWRAPFISYAAGLWLLTRIQGGPGAVAVTLAAPEDPNAYLMRVDLSDHPGLVVHPKHVVGILGEPVLKTRWRLLNLHAWATWQLRYILFTGTGSVIIEGRGDLVATAPGKPTKIEQKLIVGFDAQLKYSTSRTEVFLPYLFGKTPLVDDVFEGEESFFWQKSSSRGHKSPLARTLDAVFAALGKLLGF